MKFANEDYMTVKQACARLGISPNTLRSWGATGKVVEYRHPVNNYRLFKKEDIDNLQAQILNPKRAEELVQKGSE